METLLRLKHWQIFLLTFGITLLGVSSMFVFSLNDVVNFSLVYRVTSLVALVGASIFNAWIYMIVVTFHKKLPPEADVSLSFFKVCLAYVVIYQVTGLFLLPDFIDTHELLDNALRYLSYACDIYIFYLSATILQSAERQKKLGFGDVSGDFFAFLFYPIGIWFIQPRVNRLFNNEVEEALPDPDAPLDQGIR